MGEEVPPPHSVGSAADRAEEGTIQFQWVQVQAGDTLWSIAQRHLKDPTRWSQIIAHNPQIGSDPTVALPGRRLRVPIGMLKPASRAASLSYLEEHVEFRPSESAPWRPARLMMPLYAGNWLSTGDMSRARIKFPHGSVLNMDSHSLVVIEPPSDAGKTDLQLVRGKLKALHLTMKAKDVAVVPGGKDAVYEIAVEDGLVKVDVYGGSAEISSAGGAVTAGGGQSVAVPDRLAPGVPRAFIAADAGAQRAVERRRASEQRGPVQTTIEGFDLDLKSMPVGVAIAGFRIQAARSPEFDEIVLDRVFEPEERVTLKGVGLLAGVYWWRVAPIDLLGVSGKFSTPKRAVLR